MCLATIESRSANNKVVMADVVRELESAAEILLVINILSVSKHILSVIYVWDNIFILNILTKICLILCCETVIYSENCIVIRNVIN